MMKPKNANVFLVGPSGVGKTTAAKQLARHCQKNFCDSDTAICEHTGMSIADIFSQRGEPTFRRIEEAVIDKLTKREGVVVAIGAGAVLSQQTRQRLKKRGQTVYLQARPQTLSRHLSQDLEARPLLDGQALLPTLEAMHKQRAALYHEVADINIDVDALSVDQTVTEILKRLEDSDG